MDKLTFLREMGQRIEKCRNALGLSQEELADRANITQQTISTAERGTRGLRPENLVLVSRALGVSADYLLTGEIVDKDYLFLSEKMHQLPASQIEEIQAIITHCIQLCTK